MDLEEELVDEYHDPDYPEEVNTESKHKAEEPEKIDKIKAIIRREFDEELKYRQREIDEIDRRMTLARRMLHRLRVAVVEQYYHNPKLMLNEIQVQECIAEQPEPQGKAEVSAILRNKQKKIHPSLRKLLGKDEVNMEEIFKFQPPRNKKKNNFGIGKKNVTISHSGTIEKTLRPGTSGDSSSEAGKSPVSHMKMESVDAVEKVTKIPRRLEPEDNKKVLKINEVTRNQQKHKFRIIIGNTSKYAPASSSVDRSTHRWLLYIRGPRHAPDVSKILSHVTVRLHHTYSPHDLVHIREPPFHVSRRGWGEFPASVELHFMEPSRNPPATVQHTVTLDRRYTGAQTLGSETVVDVYLYATKEMLDSTIQSPIKQNIKLNESTQNPTNSKTNDDKNIPILNCSVKTESKDKFGSKIEKNAIKTVVKKEILDDSHEKNITNGIESPPDYLVPVVPKSEPIDYDSRESIDIKMEPGLENANNSTIHEKPTSGKSRLIKCIDSSTGRICYLKMEGDLDVNSVQSIVINDKVMRPIKNDLNGSLLGINRRSLLKKSMGVSLLKPEFKHSVKNNESKISFAHIGNDHSYCGTDWDRNISFVDDGKSQAWFTAVGTKMGLPRNRMVDRDALSAEMKREMELVDASESVLRNLCLRVKKMADVRTAVAFLLKNIPLISNMAMYSKFQMSFPFTVQSDEIFFDLNFAKRRNIEWSRAKTIEKLLIENMSQFSQKPWSPRQILSYARLHGYYPVKKDALENSIVKDLWLNSDDYESKILRNKNITNCLKNASVINTSTKFFKELYFDEKTHLDKENLRLSLKESKNDRVTIDNMKSGPIYLSEDSDEEIEIVDLNETKDEKNSPLKKKVLEVLPIDNEDDKLRCFFIEKKCMEVGLELRNEDVGNDYSYSLVHMAMLSALKSFTEEIVRASLCQKKLATQKNGIKLKIWENKHTDTPSSIELHHVYKALQQNERLHIMTKQGLATHAIEYNEGL